MMDEVHISPERRQAMINAGVWESPYLRQIALERYSNYDAEQMEQWLARINESPELTAFAVQVLRERFCEDELEDEE